MDTELINILITAAVTLVSGGGVAAVTNYVPKISDMLIDAESINTANEIMFNIFYINIHNKDFSMLLQAPDSSCRHA